MVKLKKEILVIGLIVLTEILGWSLILPFLPYLALDLGATALTVGLIISSFSLFQFLSAPIIGKLSDRYGRKPLLILSQISTFLGFLVLAFANSVWMLFLSRIIDGLLGSNMTLSNAYIADITKEKERAKTYNLMGIIFGIGFFIGPAIGGLLATINYSIPSLIAAGMSLLSIILTILLLKETVKTKKELKLKINDFFPLKDFLQAWKNKTLRGFFVEFLFYITSFTIITSSLALFIDAKLGFGPDDVGLLLMIIGLIRIIFQLTAIPKLLNKYEEKILALIGLLITTIGMFGFFFVNSRVTLYLIMITFSIGAGLTRPMLMSTVAKKAGLENRGKNMGIVDSLGSIAQIIGPIIGATIIENYNPSLLGIIAGSIIMISLIIQIYGFLKEKNSHIKTF